MHSHFEFHCIFRSFTIVSYHLSKDDISHFVLMYRAIQFHTDKNNSHNNLKRIYFFKDNIIQEE